MALPGLMTRQAAESSAQAAQNARTRAEQERLRQEAAQREARGKADAERRAAEAKVNMASGALTSSPRVRQGAGPAAPTGGGFQLPQLGLPQLPGGGGFNLTQTPGPGGGGTPPSASPSTTVPPGANLTAQQNPQLQALEAEASQYRQGLRDPATNSRIFGAMAQSAGDFMAGAQEGIDINAAQRGIAGSGVEQQMRQRTRDTAIRSGQKAMQEGAVQREALLGGAIQGALPITTAAPELALREKGMGLQAASADAAMKNAIYANQLNSQNQAFNQYMALFNAQRQQQQPIFFG